MSKVKRFSCTISSAGSRASLTPLSAGTRSRHASHRQQLSPSSVSHAVNWRRASSREALVETSRERSQKASSRVERLPHLRQRSVETLCIYYSSPAARYIPQMSAQQCVTRRATFEKLIG